MSDIELDSFYHLKKNIAIDDPLRVLFDICDNLVAYYQPNPRYYAFGGWVRDTLLGVKPSDLDFYIANKGMCSEVIKMLIATGRVDKECISKGSSYKGQFSTHHLHFITNRSEIVKVDLVTQDEEDSVPCCDFTCNNLVIYRDGQIGTRISSPQWFSESQWTMNCIQDVIAKRLVWMLSKGVQKERTFKKFEQRVEFSWKMEKRLEKMLEKGFTLSKINLTGFKLIKLKTHLDVEEGKEDSAECCGICQESFDSCQGNKNFFLKDKVLKPYQSVKLICGHYYHFACIKKWRLEQKGDSCPICRQNIYYSTL